MSNSSQKNQRTWIGIVLVILGAYFLLRNFNLIPYNLLPYWLFGWEMVFVLIGGGMLITGRKEGALFLIIGAFFLLPDILRIPRFHIRDWWPAILIITGLIIFLRRRDHHFPNNSEDDSDYLDDQNILGGSRKSFTSKNFQGGKITSIFGGSQIDFSDAVPGKDGAILDVFCLFGGTEIRIPDDWTVINESLALFGGFEDSRRKKTNSLTDPEKVLRIKGTVMFGGTEIKSA